VWSRWHIDCKQFGKCGTDDILTVNSSVSVEHSISACPILAREQYIKRHERYIKRHERDINIQI
jgi:hypothetical protein